MKLKLNCILIALLLSGCGTVTDIPESDLCGDIFMALVFSERGLTEAEVSERMPTECLLEKVIYE